MFYYKINNTGIKIQEFKNFKKQSDEENTKIRIKKKTVKRAQEQNKYKVH